MPRYPAFVAIFFILAASAGASGFADLANEARVPVAEGWRLEDDSASYPFRIIKNDQTAELLIFRAVLKADETINNDTQLRLSVDQVIDDVIMSLPEAQLLTNTGHYDQNRVWFDLEFLSFDIESESEIRHRLKGVLYRHPDDYQILFSLWGKVLTEEAAIALPEVRMMQEGFAYTGDAESRIFEVPAGYDWYLIAFLFALMIVMLFILKRRQLRERIAFSEERNFWRCSCGRLNHNDHQNCRRCGHPAHLENVS
jgi:hypothetical protein